MKLNRAEKKLSILYAIYCILLFLLTCCFITFAININNNMGILPVIFFLLSFIILFEAFEVKPLRIGYSNNVQYILNFNIVTLLLLFVNIFLLILSYVVLWK